MAQLKTIASELNLALEGREDSAKSVLTQIESLMTPARRQPHRHRQRHRRPSTGWPSRRAQQQGSIDSALDELPSALDSIDGQREDLVKMLGALNRLGDVGVRVIKASKESTVESVRQLQPVLTELANSGDDFVDSFNVFLTFPFVDEVVGRDPQVARNLHMGDFTNLSIQLDLDLTKPLLPGLPVYGAERPAGRRVPRRPARPAEPVRRRQRRAHAVRQQPDRPQLRRHPEAGAQRSCATSLELPALCNLGNLLGTGGNASGNGGGGGLRSAGPRRGPGRDPRRARPRRPARPSSLRPGIVGRASS